MKSIVSLQNVDGSWSPSDTFSLLIIKASVDIPLSPPDEFAPSLNQEVRSIAWVSVLALWLLERYCSAQKNEWKRIGAKGTNFLLEQGIVLKEALSLI